MTTTTVDLARAAQLFHALSDETRLGIIEMLRDGERCVCDLQADLDAAQRFYAGLETVADLAEIPGHPHIAARGQVKVTSGPEPLVETFLGLRVDRAPPRERTPGGPRSRGRRSSGDPQARSGRQRVVAGDHTLVIGRVLTAELPPASWSMFVLQVP